MIRTLPQPLVTAAALAFAMTALAQQPTARREADVHFTTDADLQRRGGVQYFFSLTDAVTPEFRDFDDAVRSEPLHVVMSRIEHTLDKDLSFFTAERTLDLGYMTTIAPGYELTASGAGRFRVGRMPSNDISVRFLDAAAIAASTEPALTRLAKLCGDEPQAVVAQKNSNFARIMGWRTAEASYTYTAHYPLEPGRTRVCVVTMSYLVNLPPFFTGGEARVHTESVKEALEMIRRLREYPADVPASAAASR